MHNFHSVLPLPSEKVLDKRIDLHSYSSDASYYRYIPNYIVIPDDCQDIRKLILWCKTNKSSITFRAGGTSLSGQAQTNDILIDLSKSWKNFTIEENGHIVKAQPGVIAGKINEALAIYNRKIGPDPASINSCMIGGIIANNSSGMSSGIALNPYNTTVSLSFLLHNGVFLNSAEKKADNILKLTSELIYQELITIKKDILRNEKLVKIINEKYRLKNTIGYSLNAFLDYSKPIDILSHLMIGSEGTLGFVSEAVLKTFEESQNKLTGLAFFKDVYQVCSAIKIMREKGAKVLEFMDRTSLRSIENIKEIPQIIKTLPEETYALLFEFHYHDDNQKSIIEKEIAIELKHFDNVAEYFLTSDLSTRANLWKIRQGLLTSISSMRKSGTAMIIEDFAFELDVLPYAVQSLQRLFRKYNYNNSAIYGHGTDGNLHCLISQSFNVANDKIQYEKFTNELTDIVANDYNGSLKAEHGTGRAMAPFVKKQWGEEAYNIMVRIKRTLDPDNVFNPNVLISNNEKIHLINLKSFPIIGEEIDKCIECGFCEEICPSKNLTLTPRKRISILREIERLKHENSPLVDEILKNYKYYVLDTCAVDGLCSIKCPIGINTADIVKSLRHLINSDTQKKNAFHISNYFLYYEKCVKILLRIVHKVKKITGDKFLTFSSYIIEKLYKQPIYKWNKSITKPIKISHTSQVDADFIYFPCCISRLMGKPNDISYKPITDVLLNISREAGYRVMIPSDCEGYCCGMTFLSKGYFEAFSYIFSKTINKMWEWSDEGRIPIILDSSSCSYTIKSANTHLDEKIMFKYKKLKFLDIVEYCHDYLINRFNIKRIEEKVVLHPNCSIVKMGLTDKMITIAEKCSSKVIIPKNLGCCGFAGDRGLLFPELTQKASHCEAQETIAENANLHYSSNVTCEIAMNEATGKQYLSILYLLEKVIEK